MSNLNDQLSKVIRQIESDLGTNKLAELSLTNLIDSFSYFKASSIDDFYDQFKELLVLLKTTKPRIGIVIFQFCEIWEEMQKRRNTIDSIDELKHVLEDVIHLILNQQEGDGKKLIENGLQCVKDGDSILIHSHSRTVLNIIEQAYQEKKKIRVVLAEQEEEKTHEMIVFLQDREIPFVVVPEFMLSHVEQEITKVFLGGITLNNTHSFITDAGTNSVVSEFHHAKVPIYIFLTTKKFSLWDAGKKEQTYKVTQKKSEHHPEKEVTYERIKFSHDRVPVDLLDYVVTEEGKFTPKEMVKIFDKRYKDFAEWRKKYF